MNPLNSQLEAERKALPPQLEEQVAGVFSGDVFALPASPAQERFWAFEAAYPVSRVWNVAVRWSLRGPLKTDILGRAINAVCARHEALRTCLEMQSGELIQKVASKLDLFLPLYDLRQLPEAEKEAEAERITVEGRTAQVLSFSGTAHPCPVVTA